MLMTTCTIRLFFNVVSLDTNALIPSIFQCLYSKSKIRFLECCKIQNCQFFICKETLPTKEDFELKKEMHVCCCNIRQISRVWK
jgi:hypothetical protein